MVGQDQGAQRGFRCAMTGMILGAVTVVLTVVHHWTGPLTTPMSLEQRVADTLGAVRDVAVATVLGRTPTAAEPAMPIDIDYWLVLLAAVMAALAIVLAVIGSLRGERREPIAGVLILGSLALAFQYLLVALALLLVAMLISGLIEQLDAGSSSCCCD